MERHKEVFDGTIYIIVFWKILTVKKNILI